jgi:anti-sigma factor RsiW
MGDLKKCKDLQALIQGYADGELSLAESLEIEDHLRSCDACARSVENIRALRGAFKDSALYHEIPSGLERKIRNRLGARPSRALQRALACAAGFVVAFGSFQLGSRYGRNPQPSVAQEVVNEHVRSLQAQHLMDVASTDQHTVKPWFLGKIDFSPKVKDLKDQQFPLVGGRLDYLDGRAVAALVYKRNSHVINVFTWPETSGAEGPRPRAVQGFNLIEWSENGMAYWAISDLNAAELRQFVDLYRG